MVWRQKGSRTTVCGFESRYRLYFLLLLILPKNLPFSEKKLDLESEMFSWFPLTLVSPTLTISSPFNCAVPYGRSRLSGLVYSESINFWIAFPGKIHENNPAQFSPLSCVKMNLLLAINVLPEMLDSIWARAYLAKEKSTCFASKGYYRDRCQKLFLLSGYVSENSTWDAK